MLEVNLGDVIFPIGAGILAGLFVFVASDLTGKPRDFSVNFDLALLIGLVTAFSVIALLRPDWALLLIPFG
jgi:hypothetical protein